MTAEDELRTQRYWRTATPAQRIVYTWLTGMDPPTAKPAHQQRRRPYRKTSARRPKRVRSGQLAA